MLKGLTPGISCTSVTSRNTKFATRLNCSKRLMNKKFHAVYLEVMYTLRGKRPWFWSRRFRKMFISISDCIRASSDCCLFMRCVSLVLKARRLAWMFT